MIEADQTFDRSGQSLRRTVNVIAAIVALAVAVVMPLGYGLVAHQYEGAIQTSRATLCASRLSSYIYQHPELWNYHKLRLGELIDVGEAHDGSRSRIFDSTGGTVLAEAELSTPFQLSRNAPIIVSGETVGYVESAKALDQMLERIGGVALFSLLLGACTYYAVRILPMRVIDRTLHNLRRANRTIQETNAALEVQNRALQERENALQSTKAILKHRSDQLVEAQLLGRIGDWSYRLGETSIFWSPELYELLRFDPRAFDCARDAIMDHYIGESAKQVLESQAEIMRTLETKSVDVKFRRGDGTVGDFVVISKAMVNSDKQLIGFTGTIQDISDRKRAEEQLEKLAYYDPLTGLANRSMFHRQANDAVHRCNRRGTEAAIMLLDLDRFKEVNDALGHAAGDELLEKVAHLIARELGNRHFLARLGGDEFAIILVDNPSAAMLENLAAGILSAVSEPIVLERGEVTVGTSIGIALIPRNGTNLNDLLRNADLALYRAKEDGRGRFRFFETGMSATFQHKLALSRDLRYAISENCGLAVHYQPQIELSTRRVTGFEALMRWTHPTLGEVAPSEFIPIAESSHLICDLGLWILREAARQAKAWLDAGEVPRQIAVNVSAAQIWHTDFVSDVVSILKETELPAHLLCLELTESLLVDHAEGRVRRVLTELKRIGVSLALDDFGTDYSSLGYLTQLPFDKLKVDRIFVNGIAESDRARNLVQGIIALGRGLGMKIVMEGVERADEADILSDLDCDLVQGYFFARPTVASQAIAFARNFGTRTAEHGGGVSAQAAVA